MKDKIEKKRLTILGILKSANSALGSQKIQELLSGMHYDVSERTIRFHLKAMDKEGLTECIGRQGRCITNKGLLELSKARVFEKVGFLAAKIDEISYKMTFNLSKSLGTVVINVSIVNQNKLEEACPHIVRVFEAGYSMGRLLTLFKAREMIGEIIVPSGMVGIGTVCSITLNGILLHYYLSNSISFSSPFSH